MIIKRLEKVKTLVTSQILKQFNILFNYTFSDDESQDNFGN